MFGKKREDVDFKDRRIAQDFKRCGYFKSRCFARIRMAGIKPAATQLEPLKQSEQNNGKSYAKIGFRAHWNQSLAFEENCLLS